MRLEFLTSTPPTPTEGSGTWVAIDALGRGLERLGHAVTVRPLGARTGFHTLDRYRYNRAVLRRPPDADVVVGVDLDGFLWAARRGATRYVVSLKGIIADELRNERGLVRALLSLQARWERLNVRRADLVMVTSRYCAEVAQREYGVPPELVVATLGIETLYGKHTGRFRVLEALTTLAFSYPARAELFRSELESYLLLARESGFDPMSARGSAMMTSPSPARPAKGARAISPEPPRCGSHPRAAAPFDGYAVRCPRPRDSRSLARVNCGTISRSRRSSSRRKDGPDTDRPATTFASPSSTGTAAQDSPSSHSPRSRA